MMGDPVQSLSKTVHPEVAGPKLQQNLSSCARGAVGEVVKTFLVFRGVSERWAGVAFNGGVIDLNAKFASVAPSPRSDSPARTSDPR